MLMFTEQFEVVEPSIAVDRVYNEVDPTHTVMDSPSYADNFNVVNVVVWGSTEIFAEVLAAPSVAVTSIFSDNFLWLPTLIVVQEFTEDYLEPDVPWGSLFVEDTEVFSPARYMYLLNGVPTIDVPWDYMYSDTMTYDVLWGSLFTDVFADFLRWRDYARVMGNDYLPRELYDSLFSDSFDTAARSWYLIYHEITNITPNWNKIYGEPIEWADSSWMVSPSMSESFEWEAPRTSLLIFSDEFLYAKPNLVDTTLVSDSMEWSTVLGWDILVSDNMESDFTPYTYHTGSDGYLPRTMWADTVIYRDTFDVFTYAEWGTTSLYVDNFNQATHAFNTTTLYSEGWEWVAKLQYMLTADYEFELVVWSDVWYIEDWESELPLLQYFDPFEEDFEWEPVISWRDLPSMEDDIELNLVWDSFYVDDYEAA